MSVQIVISGNRVIAHGTGFSVSGNTVENESTGKVYDNATIATVESVPDDIDSVGYEYHAGVFVPCAPYGTGDNNGYFMEVCKDCATPRSTGIPIKGGLGLDNFQQPIVDALKWDSLAEVSISKRWSNTNGVELVFPVDDTSDYVDFRVVIKDATGNGKYTAAMGSISATIGTSAAEEISISDALLLRASKRCGDFVKLELFIAPVELTVQELHATFELQGRGE